MKAKDIISVFNKIAPPEYACSWDKMIGLQLGSTEQEIKTILVTLDIDSQAIKKAISQKADLIFSHHALFFKELSQIDTATPIGSAIKKLVLNNISVFVAHTNFDAAPEGVNWTLAEQEGLNPAECKILEPTYTKKFYKYIVFTPLEAAEKVHQAIAAAGGGHIGNYSECTFRTSGQGTFKPLVNSSPYLGEKNKLAKVNETKIETIVPEEKWQALHAAVKKVHPYEEIAFDLYELKNSQQVFGLGLIGIPEKKLIINGKEIKKLAICSGNGGSLIYKAFQKGAEAFITGEVSYHEKLLAQELGIELITKGHKETEEISLPPLKKKLKKLLPNIKII